MGSFRPGPGADGAGVSFGDESGDSHNLTGTLILHGPMSASYGATFVGGVIANTLETSGTIRSAGTISGSSGLTIGGTVIFSSEDTVYSSGSVKCSGSISGSSVIYGNCFVTSGTVSGSGGATFGGDVILSNSGTLYSSGSVKVSGSISGSSVIYGNCFITSGSISGSFLSLAGSASFGGLVLFTSSETLLNAALSATPGSPTTVSAAKTISILMPTSAPKFGTLGAGTSTQKKILANIGSQQMYVTATFMSAGSNTALKIGPASSIDLLYMGGGIAKWIILGTGGTVTEVD